MKLIYLGTAASEGWPALFCRCEICLRAEALGGKDWRLRACAMVDEDLLLDVSPDIFAAKQRLRLDFSRVRHVLFTHGHTDHFSPQQLQWAAPNFARENDRTVLKAYGTRALGKQYARLMEIWDSPHSEGWLSFKALEFYERAQLDERTFVTCYPALHGEKGDAAVYLLERDGKKLFYMHDSHFLNERTFEALRGQRVDLVSVDATGGPSPTTPESRHMCFQSDIALRARMLEVGAARPDTVFVANHICIHACHLDDGRMLFHEDMACAMAAEGFVVAYDGLVLKL